MASHPSVGHSSHLMEAQATRDEGSRLSPVSIVEPSIESARLLNDVYVAELLGIHKRSLWRLVAQGEFPEPIRFGRRCSRWSIQQVHQFIESKVPNCAGREEERR